MVQNLLATDGIPLPTSPGQQAPLHQKKPPSPGQTPSPPKTAADHGAETTSARRSTSPPMIREELPSAPFAPSTRAVGDHAFEARTQELASSASTATPSSASPSATARAALRTPPPSAVNNRRVPPLLFGSGIAVLFSKGVAFLSLRDWQEISLINKQTLQASKSQKWLGVIVLRGLALPSDRKGLWLRASRTANVISRLQRNFEVPVPTRDTSACSTSASAAKASRDAVFSKLKAEALPDHKQTEIARDVCRTFPYLADFGGGSGGGSRGRVFLGEVLKGAKNVSSALQGLEL